jgi:hypothetical protein
VRLGRTPPLVSSFGWLVGHTSQLKAASRKLLVGSIKPKVPDYNGVNSSNSDSSTARTGPRPRNRARLHHAALVRARSLSVYTSFRNKLLTLEPQWLSLHPATGQSTGGTWYTLVLNVEEVYSSDSWYLPTNPHRVTTSNFHPSQNVKSHVTKFLTVDLQLSLTSM